MFSTAPLVQTRNRSARRRRRRTSSTKDNAVKETLPDPARRYRDSRIFVRVSDPELFQDTEAAETGSAGSSDSRGETKPQQQDGFVVGVLSDPDEEEETLETLSRSPSRIVRGESAYQDELLKDSLGSLEEELARMFIDDDDDDSDSDDDDFGPIPGLLR